MSFGARLNSTVNKAIDLPNIASNCQTLQTIFVLGIIVQWIKSHLKIEDYYEKIKTAFVFCCINIIAGVR